MCGTTSIANFAGGRKFQFFQGDAEVILFPPSLRSNCLCLHGTTVFRPDLCYSSPSKVRSHGLLLLSTFALTKFARNSAFDQDWIGLSRYGLLARLANLHFEDLLSQREIPLLFYTYGGFAAFKSQWCDCEVESIMWTKSKLQRFLQDYINNIM